MFLKKTIIIFEKNRHIFLYLDIVSGLKKLYLHYARQNRRYRSENHQILRVECYNFHLYKKIRIVEFYCARDSQLQKQAKRKYDSAVKHVEHGNLPERTTQPESH
jgi:hypothetical protein